MVDSAVAAEDRFGSCGALLQRVDSERFLAVLHCPSKTWEGLFALYAFNYEVAKTAEIATDPMTGAIRLQWWRDALDEIYEGQTPRQHQVVEALAAAIRNYDLPRDLFDRLIDGRMADLEEAPFESWDDLERYFAEVFGTLLRLAGLILKQPVESHDAARLIGYVSLYRGLPLHLSHGHIKLPKAVLREADIDPHDLLAGRGSDQFTEVMAEVLRRADGNLRGGSALMPAAIAATWRKALLKHKPDPLKEALELPPFRLHLACLKLRLLGRA